MTSETQAASQHRLGVMLIASSAAMRSATPSPC